MSRQVAVSCRILASLAWLGALAWFAYVTVVAWGFTLVSLVLWSVPALVLTRSTLDWWASVGHAISAESRRWLRRVWRNVALSAAAGYAVVQVQTRWFADSSFFTFVTASIVLVLGALCLVFPVVVTVWAVRRTWSLPRDLPHPTSVSA